MKLLVHYKYPDEDAFIILDVEAKDIQKAKDCVNKARLEWSAQESTDTLDDFIEREFKSASLPFRYDDYDVAEVLL